MTTFEQFAKTRYASLQQQRAELYEQLRAIQKEIEEIEKASRASGLQLVASQSERMFTATPEGSPKRNMTMKEAAVEVLSKNPGGLRATDILTELNKILGTNYVRSSLSPQLSRLKHDGIIYDTRGTWALARKPSTQQEQ